MEVVQPIDVSETQIIETHVEVPQIVHIVHIPAKAPQTHIEHVSETLIIGKHIAGPSAWHT